MLKVNKIKVQLLNEAQLLKETNSSTRPNFSKKRIKKRIGRITGGIIRGPTTQLLN
jgi:hypothetical protein